MPFSEGRNSEIWLFLAGNAPICTKNCTRTFFTDADIEVLDSTPRISDQNSIVNLWSYLIQKVSKDLRQLDDFECLKEAITFSWSSIDSEYL